jgi:hypothetical protein
MAGNLVSYYICNKKRKERNMEYFIFQIHIV